MTSTKIYNILCCQIVNIDSSYNLYFAGLEHFTFLMFNFKHTIDIYTTVVFVLIAWALGISPNSIVLADSSDHFSNIPYLGLCIERDGWKKNSAICHYTSFAYHSYSFTEQQQSL